MVVWTSPTQVEDTFAATLMRNAVYERRLKHVSAGRGARINRVRNALIEDVLASDAEWMWMVDTDMTFPDDALRTLLATAEDKKREIVGGLGYIFRPGDNPPLLASIIHNQADGNTYAYSEPPTDRYVECDATGFFCLLVHRSILEATGELFKGRANKWIDEIDTGADQFTRGPDVTFFDRVFAATGSKPLIDTSVQCGHTKKIVLTHEDALRSRGIQ